MLQFLTISIFLFFISFKSIGQDFAKAKELFIEISPLFLKVEDLKSTNIDSAKGLNKQLIKNLELIYQTDSSFKHISDYLGDCYTYENDDRKAIYWYSKQLPEYSHQEFPIACYSCIALSYCRLGELDSCKQYTLRANISFDKNYLGGTRDYLLRLKKIADNIYSGFDKKTIEIHLVNILLIF